MAYMSLICMIQIMLLDRNRITCMIYLAHVSWVGYVLQQPDPAQQLTTAGQDLDELLLLIQYTYTVDRDVFDLGNAVLCAEVHAHHAHVSSAQYTGGTALGTAGM